MSREILWTKEAAKDIEYWKKNDAAISKRIAALIESIQVNPFTGIGKPEPLRFSLAGNWSRRINQVHRLVYRIENETVIIVSCRYHY